MSIVKITELPSATSITSDDLLVMVDSGNPYVTKKISWGNIDSPQDGIIYGRKDGAWNDITGPANLQVRRGTAAEVASIIPLQGEPVWQTDEKSLVVGDGQTSGGILLGPKVPKTVLSFSGYASPTIPITSVIPPDVVRLSTAGYSFDLGGITAPSGCYEILVMHIAGGTINIRHEMTTIGGNQALIPIATDRIITPNGSNYTLAVGYSIRLIYDTVSQRWRMV